jgi:hypothetical protein
MAPFLGSLGDPLRHPRKFLQENGCRLRPLRCPRLYLLRLPPRRPPRFPAWAPTSVVGVLLMKATRMTRRRGLHPNAGGHQKTSQFGHRDCRRPRPATETSVGGTQIVLAYLLVVHNLGWCAASEKLRVAVLGLTVELADEIGLRPPKVRTHLLPLAPRMGTCNCGIVRPASAILTRLIDSPGRSASASANSITRRAFALPSRIGISTASRQSGQWVSGAPKHRVGDHNTLRERASADQVNCRSREPGDCDALDYFGLREGGHRMAREQGR